MSRKPWIVVVDDQYDMVTLHDIGSSLNVQIDAAPNEHEAVMRILGGHDRPDLVLMDDYLGNPSGGDTVLLVRMLRRRGYAGPVIAITGDDTAAKRMVLEGCVEAWPKKEIVPFLKSWIVLFKNRRPSR